jgi:hypothetical protein
MKYGRVINCRKAHLDEIQGNIENIKLNNELAIIKKLNPYKSAMAMDERIWERRRMKIVKDKKHLTDNYGHDSI